MMAKQSERKGFVRAPYDEKTMGPMFPFSDYADAMDEAVRIVQARDEAGRNAYMKFYEQFVHGSQDVSFELHRRATRIIGAERQEAAGLLAADDAHRLKRGDAVDLVNYAVFYMMLLDREQAERGA